MKARAGACLIAVVSLCSASSAQLADQSPSALQRPAGRVILLSIDGGADWIVDQLIERGRAPAFAALGRDGARADAMVTVLPSLTAVSHASLWTGAYPRVHGITGNDVPLLPRAAHTILEHESGFENTALRAEPIWLTAARAGRRVLVPQATGGVPFTRAYPDRLLQFDIYANCQRDIELVKGRVGEGSDAFRFAVGDETAILVKGGRDGVRLRLGGREMPMSAGSAATFTPAVTVRAGGHDAAVRLRLLSYDADAGSFTLLRGRICELTSSNPSRLAELRELAGTIVGEDITRLYAKGDFGPTLASGGDGEAEELLCRILEANQEYFNGILGFAVHEPWDLLVLYLPNFDAVGHALIGMLDPASAAYSTELATRVWPWLERCFERVVDTYVGSLRQRFPDATLVVGADHGMEGSGRWVYPNVALRRAGLLAVDGEGRIAVSRTRAVHLAGHGGGIFLNTVDRKAGIVPLDERARVKQQVMATLLGIRDPASGAAPIRAVFDTDVDGSGLGIGGAAGADLYFDLTPGYEDTTRAIGDAEVEATGPAGSGDHGGAPWRRGLQAIFFAAGPGVSPGFRPGMVRTIDVAPTVSHLLGIPPPPGASGHPIDLR